MIVHQIPVGQMQNFTYVVYDESTRECIIIDPSWDLEKVMDVIKNKSLKPVYIVNTHHHFDHTTGNEQLSKDAGVQIIQHEASQLPHEISVSDGDEIKFGNSSPIRQVTHKRTVCSPSICLLSHQGYKIRLWNFTHYWICTHHRL